MHRAARGEGLRRWALTMARNRRRVYIVWLLVVCAGLLGLPHLLNSLASPAITVDGSESERAGKLLGAVVPTLGNEQMVVVLNSVTANPTGAELDSAVAAVVTELGARDIVSGAIPLPRAGDRTPALAMPELLEPVHALLRDEHTAYVLVGVSGDDRERQRQAPRIQAGLDRAVSERVGDAVRPYLVGVSVFGEAVQRAEISDLLRIDLVAIPLAALLLFLVLAAPAAAAIPLAVAGASVVGTLGFFSLLVHAVPLDGMLLVGVNAIGLGIGVDYALFVVTRYRDELAAGAKPEDAVATSMATTGRTALYSGVLLLLACGSLFLVRWNVFAQAAFGTIAVVVVTLVAALTLLPALLVSATPWLGWRPRWMPHPSANTDPVPGSRKLLPRWAAHLMRRPWPYVIGITVGMGVLAMPAMDLRPGTDMEERALAGTPFIVGRTISDRDVPGLSSIVYIVAQPADGAAELGVTPLLAALRADPGVAAVGHLSTGEGGTAILAVPGSTVNSPASIQLVQRIRETIVPATLPPGSTVLVGGASALTADVLTETSTKLWQVIGCVLGVMFLVLTWALRSLLLPLKALVMSLLATGAAFGLMALAFPRDMAAEDHSLGSSAIWPQVPLIVFAVLFGLTTDYELFLVRRIQEEYRRTADNGHSIVAGLCATARPISLAAAIIAVAFGSLLVSSIESVRAFGFAVAAGLIIDATVLRLALVPALMQLMGRWNWWFPLPTDHGKAQLVKE
ncbi:MMPL family transporter [Nocardia brasiliensis]|uniref:MMPL family transporter n=1 Tax=Nocardia brasiliensis TaxID=37326 RepID=A0A6G9XTN4_NOCBR|nr:MMPL family transporter [Nocardia brasiliensis]